MSTLPGSTEPLIPARQGGTKPKRTSKSGSELFIVGNSDEEWSVKPLQALAAEARHLERRVAELENAAYGLTPEEVALLWWTAPPRMPGDPLGT